VRLTHQSAESLKCSWNSDVWIYLYQNSFCCMNIYLKEASFIERGVKKGEEAL
jgi:hypothetical protein